MNDATSLDVEAYAETMAEALSLPLTPEYAPQVEANIALAFRLVQLVLELCCQQFESVSSSA
jgi:hypothetical protein